MTAAALIKRADLRRLADLALEKGVTVWIDVDGKRIGVSPDTDTKKKTDRDASRPIIPLF